MGVSNNARAPKRNEFSNYGAGCGAGTRSFSSLAGGKTGSISLLHRMEDMVANLNDCNRPQGWTNFQALWRQLPKLQFSLLRNVRPIADEELHLPRKLWPFPRQREEAEGIVMQLLPFARHHLRGKKMKMAPRTQRRQRSYQLASLVGTSNHRHG